MRVKKHSAVTTPHGNSSLWRYMSLEKFLDLVTNQRLFFSNAGKMTDKFEGTMPLRNVEAMRSHLRQELDDPAEIESQLGHEQSQIEGLRRLTLLNCWSLGDHESYALWKIYLSGARAGVAVRTTVSRLRRALENGKDPFPEDIYIGKVEYSDFIRATQVHRFQLITTKTPAYEYEREVRLFIAHDPGSGGKAKPPYPIDVGRHVRVHADGLIDRIYLSPFAGSWFGDVFRATLTQIAPRLVERIQASGIRDQ